MDWVAKTLGTATIGLGMMAGASGTRAIYFPETLTPQQQIEYQQKQQEQKLENTYQWDEEKEVLENLRNGAETTANIVKSTIVDIADKATKPENAAPYALGALTSAAALTLYENRKNKTVEPKEAPIGPSGDNPLEETDEYKRLKPEFEAEETILAEGENGYMQNGALEKQSKLMQYAIKNMKKTGDKVSVPIQNGAGKVTIKRIGDLDIQREGFKVAKFLEKADNSKVTYDITVLQYPQYDKTEVYHNRMFEYKPNNDNYLSPDNACALYERRNGKTMPDAPTNYNSAQNFLKKAYSV